MRPASRERGARPFLFSAGPIRSHIWHLPLCDPASLVDSRHRQYSLIPAWERLPTAPPASSAQSPLPAQLPPGLRPCFPALAARSSHLRTSSDACPLPRGVIYLLRLVILSHVHYNTVHTTHTTSRCDNLQSFVGRHSPHPGHPIKTDSKARATTLWPALLETIPPLRAVSVKRLLQ